MPGGKPAGVACAHLSTEMRCALFGDSRRPAVCHEFMPEVEYCGDTREQALMRLAQLEIQSAPDTITLALLQSVGFVNELRE